MTPFFVLPFKATPQPAESRWTPSFLSLPPFDVCFRSQELLRQQEKSDSLSSILLQLMFYSISAVNYNLFTCVCHCKYEAFNLPLCSAPREFKHAGPGPRAVSGGWRSHVQRLLRKEALPGHTPAVLHGRAPRQCPRQSFRSQPP